MVTVLRAVFFSVNIEIKYLNMYSCSPTLNYILVDLLLVLL